MIQCLGSKLVFFFGWERSKLRHYCLPLLSIADFSVPNGLLSGREMLNWLWQYIPISASFSASRMNANWLLTSVPIDNL